jgi:hypothetical protein
MEQMERERKERIRRKKKSVRIRGWSKSKGRTTLSKPRKCGSGEKLRN